MTESHAYALLAAGLFVVAYLSAMSVWHNWQQVQTARSVAPLDGHDLSAASVVPVPAPKHWPVVETVEEPAVAAAYASLAEDRLLTRAMVGELLMIVGGAAVGVVLPDALRGGWRVAQALGALAVASLGVSLRMRATHVWDPLAARYRARYAVLTATPESLPEPSHRPWWSRLVPSRTRRTR